MGVALEPRVDIDLEFATLSAVNQDGKLKIVFTPKEAMVDSFKNVQKEKKTRLKKKLEKVVLNSLLETYKEI